MAGEIAVRLMTKTEAKEARDKINLAVGSMAALVKDFYNREGWRALGYKNWTECASKEFAHNRSRVYQLLDEANVSAELGPDAPPISGRAARALKDVPKGKRKAALAAAQEEHKTKKPTEKQVKATVKKNKAWAPSGVRKPKEKSIAEQAVTDEKLQKALAILGGTCGRAFRKAVEDGTIAMSRGEVLHLSEQDDETMLQAEKLIAVQRWPLKRALAFLSDMPTLQTKLEQLTWLAVSSATDIWQGVFGAFEVTVKVNRKKLR